VDATNDRLERAFYALFDHVHHPKGTQL
jgi:hypothetical protein